MEALKRIIPIGAPSNPKVMFKDYRKLAFKDQKHIENKYELDYKKEMSEIVLEHIDLIYDQQNNFKHCQDIFW